MEGESRVVVRARGEFGEIINGDGKGCEAR